MGAIDLIFITLSHNVSFMGKTWWMLMLPLRLLVVLLAGFTLFSDEQDRFICSTIQPGCSNACFDVFAPVSVFRLWLFHFLLLCLPHVLFATYVTHKVLSYPDCGAFYCDSSTTGSPFTVEASHSSRELSLHKAAPQDLPRGCGAPRFYCSYLLVVILRIFLEVCFAAGQFFIFGLSTPQSFLCYEAPCTPGVECYTSRPTEKTLMLTFMLGVSSLSILVSFVDLVSSMKAMGRWRRKKAMLMEEMSKGEQSSIFTVMATTEDSDGPLTRRISPSGSSKDVVKDGNPKAGVPNGELLHSKVKSRIEDSAHDKRPENKDAKADISPSPSPMSSPMLRHLRPPLPHCPDRSPTLTPRVPTHMGVKNLSLYSPVAANPGRQSENTDSQDRRAWV